MSDQNEFYPWLSAAAIIWGLLDVFFGYRVFKITLAVVGGLLGLAAAQALADAIGLHGGGEVAALVTGAMLGTAVAFLLYLAAVFVAGFGFGATLALLLLANHHPLVTVVAGIILGLVGGFLAVKTQRILIVLSTSLLGSFRAVLGLCYFTGQIDWLYYIRQPEQFPALLEGNSWMLPAILVLAVVGVLAQFELGKTKAAKKAKDE